MIGVMFVCTGNICRSPMAEAIFLHLLKEEGLENQFRVASSGTDSWHVGERPHHGTQRILRQMNISLSPQKRAQQIKGIDFDNYKYILAMDQLNVNSLKKYGEVRRLLEFAPAGSPKDVPDPYYEDNFDEVFRLIMAACKNLLSFIKSQEGIE